MTCKGCLHYKACLSILMKSFPDTEPDLVDSVTSRDTACKNFEDCDALDHAKKQEQKYRRKVGDQRTTINALLVKIDRLNKEVDRLSQCVLYTPGIISDLEKDKEELTIELQAMRNAANSYKAEVKRLKSENARVHEVMPKMIKTAKSEARKEFVEKIKEKAYTATSFNDELRYVVNVEDIDILLKEMVGEDN